METHVITAHGLTLTSDTIADYNLDSAPEEIKLPPNMIVIANCYNRKTWISPKTSGVIWYFLMHEIHKQLDDITVSPSNQSKFLNLFSKYVTLLAAFSVVNENKMCAYINESPNIAFYFKEQAFRSGVFTPPMQVTVSQPTKGGSRRRSLKKMVGGSKGPEMLDKTKFANYLVDFDSSEEYTCMTPEELEAQGFTDEDTQQYEQCKRLFHDPVQSFTRPSYNARKENGFVYDVVAAPDKAHMVFDYQTMSSKVSKSSIFGKQYVTLEQLIEYHKETDKNFNNKFHVYIMNTCRTSKTKTNVEKRTQNFMQNNANTATLKHDIIGACELPVDDDIDFNLFKIGEYTHGNQEQMDTTCRVDHVISKKRIVEKVQQWYKSQNVAIGGSKHSSKVKKPQVRSKKSLTS